jgi:hypothetical protein
MCQTNPIGPRTDQTGCGHGASAKSNALNEANWPGADPEAAQSPGVNAPNKANSSRVTRTASALWRRIYGDLDMPQASAKQSQYARRRHGAGVSTTAGIHCAKQTQFARHRRRRHGRECRRHRRQTCETNPISAVAAFGSPIIPVFHHSTIPLLGRGTRDAGQMRKTNPISANEERRRESATAYGLQPAAVRPLSSVFRPPACRLGPEINPPAAACPSSRGPRSAPPVRAGR